jgi:hypothetical protein
MERKIYNPIQRDQVIFLKTHADTGGEYTLVEVELADGGGVGLHYHKTYAEKFSCLDGEVQVQLGKSLHKLMTGESAIAEPMIGLASDGLCKPNGFPKDKLALAWLFDISESNLPGWRSIFEFILREQAKKARMKGIDR